MDIFTFSALLRVVCMLLFYNIGFTKGNGMLKYLKFNYSLERAITNSIIQCHLGKSKFVSSCGFIDVFYSISIHFIVNVIAILISFWGKSAGASRAQ